MERELSKQQEAVLIRAQIDGGICHSSAAYAVLVDVDRTLRESKEESMRESKEESIVESVGSTLQSLVELGLMEKTGPGEYHLTEEGFRVAEGRERYPFV